MVLGTEIQPLYQHGEGGYNIRRCRRVVDWGPAGAAGEPVEAWAEVDLEQLPSIHCKVAGSEVHARAEQCAMVEPAALTVAVVLSNRLPFCRELDFACLAKAQKVRQGTRRSH